MASGHNYQLVDLNTHRVVNVEVASFGRSSVREQLPGQAAFFHANTYETLNVPGQFGSNRYDAYHSAYDPPYYHLCYYIARYYEFECEFQRNNPPKSGG